MERIAVVLYNLGGPDKPEAIQPFLFNLFNDPLILRLSPPIRWILAKIISSRRTPIAKEIYAKIGGGSPILEETRKQAWALQEELEKDGKFKVFVAMRYWRPFADECIDEVINFNPDSVILLPLYPQFSTTTTESFLRIWKKNCKKRGFDKSTASVCCYPQEAGFVKAVSELLKLSISEAESKGPVKVLFSAHGIPKKFVVDGDPYESHVRATVGAVIDCLNIPNLNYEVCYQSRVGPIEWLRPYTDEVIIDTAQKGHSIVVVPIAFVSEHSETLVELDMEYLDLALDNGATAYIRTPTVGVNANFIFGLASIVREAVGVNDVIAPRELVCKKNCAACPGVRTGQ
ncbi:MAG: ferrochelatase [Rhodospirillaceae bacterium]|nr:ferrochelatase [Rhodospirillaceae bacterium]